MITHILIKNKFLIQNGKIIEANFQSPSSIDIIKQLPQFMIRYFVVEPWQKCFNVF